MSGETDGASVGCDATDVAQAGLHPGELSVVLNWFQTRFLSFLRQLSERATTKCGAAPGCSSPSGVQIQTLPSTSLFLIREIPPACISPKAC